MLLRLMSVLLTFAISITLFTTDVSAAAQFKVSDLNVNPTFVSATNENNNFTVSVKVANSENESGSFTIKPDILDSITKDPLMLIIVVVVLLIIIMVVILLTTPKKKKPTGKQVPPSKTGQRGMPMQPGAAGPHGQQFQGQFPQAPQSRFQGQPQPMSQQAAPQFPNQPQQMTPRVAPSFPGQPQQAPQQGGFPMQPQQMPPQAASQFPGQPQQQQMQPKPMQPFPGQPPATPQQVNPQFQAQPQQMQPRPVQPVPRQSQPAGPMQNTPQFPGQPQQMQPRPVTPFPAQPQQMPQQRPGQFGQSPGFNPQQQAFTPTPTGMPGRRPPFTVSNLNITPQQVKEGDTVNISAVVTNNTSTSGQYSMVLRIGGVVENISELTLNANSSQTALFTIIRDTPGEYYVEVDGQRGVFNVARRLPASFNVSNLTITPERVKQGEPVTISTIVSNSGETTGNYSVVLRIKGIAENIEEVELGPGRSQKVVFSIVKDAAGFYPVAIENLTGKFVIEMDWKG